MKFKVRYKPHFRYEFLNFITGILLIIAGLIKLFDKDYVTVANWVIFGAMYLVMDDYTPKPSPRNSVELIFDLGRKIFSWVGLFGSIFILLYYLFF